MTVPRPLLLTQHFPYGVRESFLEGELTYLAEALNVAILPTAVAPHERAKRRTMPDGVKVYETAARRLSASAWSQVGRFLGTPTLWWQNLSLAGGEAPPMVRRLASSALHELLMYRELLCLPPADIYYGYWLAGEALALSLLKRTGRAGFFLVRAHGYDLYRQLLAGRYQPYQEWVVSHLDQMVSISEDGQRYLHEKYPVDVTKIAMSRLGANAAERRNVVVCGGQLHLASCAFLSPVKRIGLLIDALAHCSFPVRWTHLGGGKTEATLRAQAERLPENVTWTITGNLPNEAVLAFYQREPVDLFVNVSASEGVPVSIMEALSYGIPVAATNVDGTGELVDGSNGFLLPAGVTGAGLARTLTRFQGLSGAEQQKLRDAAWQTWQVKANAEKQYRGFAIWLRREAEKTT